MKLAGICDRDTAVGLRLTGLQDVSIPEKNGDTIRMWNELSTRDDVGVIFITEAIAEELGKLLAEFRLRQTIPIIVEIPDVSMVEPLTEKAVEHIELHSFDGSDPGLCVASEEDPSLDQLIAFGRTCTKRIVTQGEALKAASSVHLSAHGGTDDGIIGAAAAVGLTASGWSGRFIEFGRLRDFSKLVQVSDLERSNILVVSVDRDAKVPAPEDLVYTKGWLRPRLWGMRAVLSTIPKGNGIWESLGEKRHKKKCKEKISTYKS